MVQFIMPHELVANTGVGSASQQSTTQGYQRAQAFRAGGASAATPWRVWSWRSRAVTPPPPPTSRWKSGHRRGKAASYACGSGIACTKDMRPLSADLSFTVEGPKEETADLTAWFVSPPAEHDPGERVRCPDRVQRGRSRTKRSVQESCGSREGRTPPRSGSARTATDPHLRRAVDQRPRPARSQNARTSWWSASQVTHVLLVRVLDPSAYGTEAVNWAENPMGTTRGG